MLPDFNRLRIFFHVYDKKSISAAAVDLNITQSAISQHLKKLESEINTPLFTRLHRRLVPTSAGMKLYERLKPFVDALEADLRTLSRSKDQPFGILRIGAPVEFGREYLPGLFARFRNRYENVKFILKLANPGTLISMMQEGELDFAYIDIFSPSKPYVSDLSIFSIEPLIEEEVILACSEEYYENFVKNDHSFNNLISLEYIAYLKNYPELRSWFHHHFKKRSLSLNIVLIIESVQAVVTAIENNMGVAVVPSHLVWKKLKQKKIKPILTEVDEMINKISLIQFHDKIPTITEKVFQAFFKNQLQNSGILEHFCRISKIVE